MPVKISRRNFLKSTLLVGTVGISSPRLLGDKTFVPGAIATWPHARGTALAARKLLAIGTEALDIVEKSVNVTESDPNVMSVGYGGLPDENGEVTLDACIMDGKTHRAGSVAFLKNIKNPVSVARKVMETTRHVMLAGEGALDFARKMGFKEENLLTDKARERWLQWKRNVSPKDNWLDESHDTITMLALDAKGNIAAACTTSGLAYKIHGRVGDSPIIGAGLYVDNEIGAAGATGVGELVMQTLTSFMIVEFMRGGLSPSDACRKAFERMVEKIPSARRTEEAFIAINKKGEVGCATNTDRFEYYYIDKKKVNLHKPTPIK